MLERYRIKLDTEADIHKIHLIATSHPEVEIMIEDLSGSRINAKSLLGLFATKDFNGLYLTSNKPIYTEIKDFII